MSNETIAPQVGNENLIDEDLQYLLGDRYQGEAVKPPVAEYEDIPVGPGPEGCCADGYPVNPLLRLMATVKWPVFFLALCAFIGWSGHMELMEEIIAVPGMCICSACFGWHVRK